MSGPITAVGITETPVSASCALAHGVRSWLEDLGVDAAVQRLLPRLDRRWIVLPRPAAKLHGRRLTSPPWPHDSWTGRDWRSAFAPRSREEVRQLGDVGLATVLVGDDPASDVYVRRKHEAAQEVGIRSIDHRLPAETLAGGAGARSSAS